MRRVSTLVLLAACAGRPEAPILIWHSVGETADEYTVPRAAFERDLDWLASSGFHTISLHELAEARASRSRLPAKAVVLTFDDGKEDALRLVLPALRTRGMRATFFVITSHVGEPGYLTWDGVRALANAGMEIGSHTATHPRLPEMDDDRVRQELSGSRAALEQHLGRPVEAIAYPYNAVRSHIARLAAAAGYRIGVAGLAHGGKDLLSLRREPINGMTSFDDFQRVVSE